MRAVWIVLLTLCACALGLALAGYAFVRTHTFGAERPGPVESFVASHALSMSIPAAAKEARNPVVVTPEILAHARDHFARDCAFCHANNGAGKSEAGTGMYPPTPDLRREDDLTDGELFFIIKHGVRWTGMPRWKDPDDRVWQLVSFIRHLPRISAADLEAMSAINHLGTGEVPRP